MASAVIYGSRSGSGNQPVQRRLLEAASQTFLQGTPVMLVGGYLQAWDGATITNGIVGISAEAARNRTTAGVAQVINPASIAVTNQPNSVNITLPPFDDGRLNVYQSINDTYFFAQVGPSQSAAQTLVGQQYGLTKDSDGHWYVDTTKSTPGTNTVVQVVDLDTVDTARGVYFQFLNSALQQA